MVTALDKNTALILIDLQKGVLHSRPIKALNEVLENAAKLVDAFHKAGLPVVLVNVNPAKATWMNVRKDAKQQQALPTAEGWLDIVPEIKSQPGDIFITKHTWGAFYETALDEELKKRNVTGIVLGGVSTSIGVEGTARGASERGYNITFAKDAMTDMFDEAHEHSLKYIFPRIGETGETKDVIEMLSTIV